MLGHLDVSPWANLWPIFPLDESSPQKELRSFYALTLRSEIDPPMINTQRIKTDVLALGLLAVVLFLGLSLFSFNPADPPTDSVFPSRTVAQNLGGSTGATLAFYLRNAFGVGAWFILLALVSIDLRLFARDKFEHAILQGIGICLSLTAFCAGMQLLEPGLGNNMVAGSGGYLGAWSHDLLEQRFALPGIVLLIISFFAGGMLLSNEVTTLGAVARVVTLPIALAVAGLGRMTGRAKRVEKWNGRVRSPFLKTENQNSEPEDEYEDDEPVDVEEEEDDDDDGGGIRVNRPVGLSADRDALNETLESQEWGEYELPGLELLEQAEDFPYEKLKEQARIAASLLEEKCREFGINVEVVEADTGPVITQFELKLEKGLRLSKVKSLSDDLAVGLKVPSVRIVPSIPGKNTVGVEVPNEDRVMVRLRELIESSPAEFEKHRIPLYLGKDVSGRPLVVDMAKMPHLLIAGRTGTGKSVCLNTLIASILMTRTPDQVRMLMIDPKMVELSPYKNVPHLMHPVVTDMKKAEAMLGWAVEKMDERYDLMARCGVRHLDAYNKLGHEKILRKLGLEAGSGEAELVPETMPSIVIIADEMADMMMTCGKDVEQHIARLAGKSRAVGIHLVLATQKPTVDVVTGLIKSNLPARISFQVASQVDSRVVLDETGADKLLGNGDMLYLAPGTSHVSRAQGTYVSDDEISDIIEFYSQYETQYDPELEKVRSADSGGGAGGRKGNRIADDFYNEAVEIVLAEGRGSISMLQSRLGIGYGRAKRMIDYMTEDGVVAAHNGANAREVIMSFEDWEAQRDVAT